MGPRGDSLRNAAGIEAPQAITAHFNKRDAMREALNRTRAGQRSKPVPVLRNRRSQAPVTAFPG